MAQCVATGCAEAEFALVVADGWQRRGIGTALCGRLLEHARERRFVSLAGFVLTENRPMLGFAVKLGFSLVRDTDATLTRAVLALADPRLPAPGETGPEPARWVKPARDAQSSRNSPQHSDEPGWSGTSVPVRISSLLESGRG